MSQILKITGLLIYYTRAIFFSVILVCGSTYVCCVVYMVSVNQINVFVAVLVVELDRTWTLPFSARESWAKEQHRNVFWIQYSLKGPLSVAAGFLLYLGLFVFLLPPLLRNPIISVGSMDGQKWHSSLRPDPGTWYTPFPFSHHSDPMQDVGRPPLLFHLNTMLMGNVLTKGAAHLIRTFSHTLFGRLFWS